MKDNQLIMRISSHLKEAATREATGRGLTLSDWVRGLITEATGGPLLPRNRRTNSPARKGKSVK